MDTLTHGLLGAVAGAVPLPRWRKAPDESALAALAVGILAAELPDIDYLIPAADTVLHTLKAHRGPTHSLLAAPLVALVAATVVRLIFRRADFLRLYARALLAVPLAHLLPDLWTGWGTRLFLPFSDERIALDWTMVVDPWFTLPLLAGAVWAFIRRAKWKQALMIGAAVSCFYLGARVALAHRLTTQVAAAYPEANSVHVFPKPLGFRTWRYVVKLEDAYAAGVIRWGDAVKEEARLSSLPTGPVPDSLKQVDTVREALNWARFPVVRVQREGGSQRVEVSDLRYHLKGKPALTFVMTVSLGNVVTDARLERNVGLRDLIRSP